MQQLVFVSLGSFRERAKVPLCDIDEINLYCVCIYIKCSSVKSADLLKVLCFYADVAAATRDDVSSSGTSENGAEHQQCLQFALSS